MIRHEQNIIHDDLRIQTMKEKIARFSKKYINRLKIHSNLYTG